MTTSHLIHDMIRQIREVPEYFIALKAGLAVIAMGVPVYAGLRYFLYRRQLKISIWVTFNFIGSFILFGGLAFLLASPLASYISGPILTTYLFVTCAVAAMGAVSIIDVFLIRHYLMRVKHIYVSSPLQMMIQLVVFFLAALPILRYVLHFNPLALVAIPTIATAGLALALQDTVKAFFAGITLGHTIRIGEWIGFQDKQGRVLDLSWSRTEIQSADGARISIPNNLLQNGVFQILPPGGFAIYKNVKISVSYEVAPERVKEALLRSIQGVSGLAGPSFAYITQYTDAGIVYGLFYTLQDYNLADQKLDEVATKVWHAFQKEGISISYPSRNVYAGNGAEVVKAKRPSPKKI